MTKKEKEELKPEIVDSGNQLDKDTITTLRESFGSENDFYENTANQSADSYFKNVLNQLMDVKKDLSAKTEYLSPEENFAGAKLGFLSKYGGMPLLSEFLDVWEMKRISLERKGRQEILLALERRQEEIQRENSVNFNGMLATGRQ